MRKLILIVHMSLDGFIAGENGSFENFSPSLENLDLVNSLTDDADTLLAGRNSYEMLDGAWPNSYKRPGASASEIKYSNWYNAAEKIILSTTLPANEKITVVNGNVAETINQIKNRKGKSILMFGSPTAFKTLSEFNLIDEYWVILYPTIFGKGITWFSNSKPKTLTLLETRQLTKGELALHYKVN
jgi:dihydrofolate reductase